MTLALATGRLAHFDALYEADDDPWGYARSDAEARKRRAVLAALGSGPLGRGLELGCGPGVATAGMAPRFAALLALDGSLAAVRIARRRTAGMRAVRVERAVMPPRLCARSFDAVVATEVLYYLPRPVLGATLRAVRAALAPGGALVSTNSLERFGDAAVGNAELVAAQRAALGAPARTVVGAGWRLDLYRPG